MRVVLVTGGRYYGESFGERRHVFRALDTVHAEETIDVLVHGGARGVDKAADAWAEASGVDRIVYPANWQAHGKAAGPMRNRRMLEHARPGLVLAFPGGRGTADMVRQARAAGIETRHEVLVTVRGTP